MVYLHDKFSQEPLNNSKRLKERNKMMLESEMKLHYFLGCLNVGVHFDHSGCTNVDVNIACFLHLIECVHCRCSERSLCRRPGNHTAGSCKNKVEVVTTIKYDAYTNMHFNSGILSKFRTQRNAKLFLKPFEGPHLEKFVHYSTLHLSKEEPSLREKLCHGTRTHSLTQHNDNIL